MNLKFVIKRSKQVWLPTIVTMCRIFGAPILLFTIPAGLFSFSAILFLILSLTDWLDGHLARRLKASSKLGQLLDPVGDKILVFAALIALTAEQLIPSWIVFLFLTRDFLISAIRSAAAADKNWIVSASRMAKIKTALQMTALVILIAFANRNLYFQIGYILLLISLFLSLSSAIQYILAFRVFDRPKS